MRPSIGGVEKASIPVVRRATEEDLAKAKARATARAKAIARIRPTVEIPECCGDAHDEPSIARLGGVRGGVLYLA
jgi:hypothetical protein